MLSTKCHIKIVAEAISCITWFILLVSASVFAQTPNKVSHQVIENQRSKMILNLSEQVRWPNIKTIETFKIGVLGSQAITNNLVKFSADFRLYEKLIEVNRLSSLEEVKNYNIVYVSIAHEYLLKDILSATRKNKILVITEGYPINSSMINIISVGDTYNYDINRMYFREANLKMSSNLASYAVTSSQLKENLYKNVEYKLSVVTKENDEQKVIIEKQIETIGNQKENLNKKEEVIIAKNSSINNLFLESKLMSQKIEEKTTLEKLNEQKIKEQIVQLNLQQKRIDSINSQIQEQQKVLILQSKSINEKTAILAKKNIIIDTQRKQNIVLSIFSILLLILSLSLFVAYLKNKKLNNRLQSQHKEINKQSKLLTSKNKELEQFAYIASHDLQEPLNTITSFIDIIEEEYHTKFDDDGKKMLGFIKEGGLRMKVMIDALLQYSRLGRSKAHESVNCMPLLDVLTADLHNTIKTTSAEIKYENLPVIKGNEVELRLLFQNLISNGIKFRDPGKKPEINIACEAISNDNSTEQNEQKSWVFSVTDNGIGIAQEYQDRVFSIFQRLHSRLEYEGSGIGLAHCKKIVEAHSGKIWFTSEKGVGTTFCFSIPIEV